MSQSGLTISRQAQATLLFVLHQSDAYQYGGTHFYQDSLNSNDLPRSLGINDLPIPPNPQAPNPHQYGGRHFISMQEIHISMRKSKLVCVNPQQGLKTT